MELIKAALIKKFEEALEAKYIYVTHDGIYNVTRHHYVNNVAVIRYIGCKSLTTQKLLQRS